jgi:hypothetical protein
MISQILTTKNNKYKLSLGSFEINKINQCTLFTLIYINVVGVSKPGGPWTDE